MYTRGGVFIAAPTTPPDSVIDLAGAFVVSPFAEGHNHWLELAALQAYIQSYLRDGVFYVKDQGSSPYVRAQIDSGLNRPSSVDFISANQGWTGPGGHPMQIARQFIVFGVFPRAWADSGIDPNVVMEVRDSADIAARWPAYLAGRPDFVKVFLLNSEEYERRKNINAFLYKRGIDPHLVSELVRRAHAAGLRVSAHIYTAADFRNAVQSGVDDIAHFPGTGLGSSKDLPLSSYQITDADASETARRGVTVTTTLSWLSELDTARRSIIVRDVIRPNLALLRKYSVRVLIGSDQFRETPAPEADLLVQLALFTPLEALQSWSIDTPRSLFPHRRIGEFAAGAEASFIALRGDPLADFGMSITSRCA